VTNPRGYTTTYGYDAANRRTTVTDAGSPAGTVTFGYDRAGRTTSVTNPRGYATTYGYDELGNVLTETDPLDRTRESAYDLAGLLTQTTDARGVVIKYVYDDANRLTNVRDENGDDLIAYAYDALGRRTQMVDATGTTGWVYDGASRVTSVASPQGTVAYTYDDVDRRATMTLPGSRTVAYGYDAAGQLTSVEDWQSRETTYGYEPDGQLATVERPNGVGSAYDYDGAGRLTAISHFAPNSVALAEYAYELDANGNRIAVEITGSAVTNATETYAYDALDRLTEVEYDDGVNPVETIDYAYDKNGNRTSLTSGSQVTAYTYDAADQLTATTGAISATYTYDANGNRTAVNGDSFTWDWNDRLTEAEVGSSTVAFAYDGDDTRSTKTVGSTTTEYLWDRDAGLLVDDGTTAALHGAAGPLAEIDGSNAATYPLADGLGSVRGETDGSGDVVATADYDVFGGTRAQSGTAGVFGWTGEQQDAETGLTYLRARYYAPGSGRFLSRDTVEPNAPGTQGYNPYAYTADNPVTRTDPGGHAFAFTGTAAFSESGLGGELAIAGGGAALLAIGAFVGANLAWIALFLLVVLVLYELERWCLDHDINPGSLGCVGAAESGVAQGGIDVGKSWVTFAFGAAASAAGATWDAIPKPWTKPGDQTWPPVPPVAPVPPQRPQVATPRAASQSETRERVEPIPIPWSRPQKPRDKCPSQAGGKVYHRVQTESQSFNTSLLQEASRQIWGSYGNYGYEPSVKAFNGPLPPGEQGIEFISIVPVNQGSPPRINQEVHWTPDTPPYRPPEDLHFSPDGIWAILECVQITKDTQVPDGRP
jgi:RHS repeat-associated protein